MKTNEPAIVYTFEEIVNAQNYPKAYSRKFVVVEKYQELEALLKDCLSVIKGVNKIQGANYIESLVRLEHELDGMYQNDMVAQDAIIDAD